MGNSSRGEGLNGGFCGVGVVCGVGGGYLGGGGWG